MSVQIEVERYRVVETRVGTNGNNVKGRYLGIGLGGYGSKLICRVCQQLKFSRVDELGLAMVEDLDAQQMNRLAKQVIPHLNVPVVYPKALGIDDFHDSSEGEVQASIERCWARRDTWLPITDRLIRTTVSRLERELIQPAAIVLGFSCGGHLLIAAYVAYRFSLEFPNAKVIGITAIPGDEKSAAEALKFLENVSKSDPDSEYPWQSDERVVPLFDHMLLTDNGLNAKVHDRVVPMTLAALASKVRGEQSGSESLLNILELLRKHKVPEDETSYITLEYGVELIPVKKPRKPCWFGQVFLRRPVIEPYTDTPVLSARTDGLINTLTTGHGIPAFEVQTDDAAMIVSVPSSNPSWEQVQRVESEVTEKLRHRGEAPVKPFHGPYWGRWPVESSAGATDEEPLAVVMLERIHGGRQAVRQAILEQHPGIRSLLPSATLPLGLTPALEMQPEIREMSGQEQSA